MAIDPRERYSDPEETLRAALEDDRAKMWTTLPGIIVSFDPGAVTAVVQPAIQGVVRASDGSAAAVDLPQLYDVPVVFPRGGGVTLTFPIKPGDECKISFSARCIDGWWQSGGVQLPMDTRMHDLSDAFCEVGPQSQVKKISNISTTSAQLRTDDGNAFIEIDPASNEINVTTAGDVNVTAAGDLTADIEGDITVSAGGDMAADVAGSASVTAASIDVYGPTTFHGTVHFAAAVTGASTAVFDTDVIGGGISLKNHKTSLVQPGGGQSGPPVP